jgi:hypothetical protein
MYTYNFQIYTRDRNWEFIGVIFVLVDNMFRALGGVVRFIYKIYKIRYISNVIVFHPEDGPKGPKHVVN